MKVLAMDTTTPQGSVAVIEGGESLGEVRLKGSINHSTRILPAVAFLLDSLGIVPADLDGIGVTIGPGSYTGIRVGIGTIQGFALAAGLPCVGVSALDALAHRIQGIAPMLVAMIDAYREEVFAASYDARARPLLAPAVRDPGAFVADLPEAPAFLGDGAVKYQSLIRRLRPKAIFPERSLFLATSAARLSMSVLAEGRGVSPSEIRPLYLRAIDARRTLP
ncbi:MAG: tRNA (adenosine(37)-N6)-threonylcarbamoyltransferase complex dimerization subunit type 1 TsaB [Vicinamibacteria bacterium]|nr:tRNA (adenosine(37)-N6)-threonylcarbamoyltransferase complex dimerization subunit type 1 TsaB [Vicinamibacteria bacterium]